ncbi:hypothetical protein [Streptantibioticus ferralitis]|uniref:Uncharacterized protein n=1 Tax=Streptantibioticus ferralitis TaxID=236510 RepID=A0ABT5Z021_9ACTN|nr:hypothetical protein [Streptantibioticus ferralitis]MDF2257198.1 hypothetical protein [Streptantibioticus ferralitis]
MTKPLPRTYWCHVDHDGPQPGDGPPHDITTDEPGQAVEWVRESVRAASVDLDRATFHRVWGWLGDHRAVQAAVVELRRGKPYTFAVPAPAGRWTWIAYPVSVLPLTDTAVNYASSLRRLAPAGAIGGPP